MLVTVPLHDCQHIFIASASHGFSVRQKISKIMQPKVS